MEKKLIDIFRDKNKCTLFEWDGRIWYIDHLYVDLHRPTDTVYPDKIMFECSTLPGMNSRMSVHLDGDTFVKELQLKEAVVESI